MWRNVMMMMVSVLALVAGVGVGEVAAAERPNLVVVLCDDLGYGDLGCYGHPHIRTPHLDRMAAEGVRFRACYSAAPVCSPSRVGLLTGRSPNRAGVYDWIPPARPGAARPDAREQVHLRADEVTVAGLLKAAGYATCLSGKWHCNAMFNSGAQAQPDDAGFDHWFATQNNAAPSHENPGNYVRNGEAVGVLEGFSCQLATDEVLRWIEGKGSPGSDEPPFFVLLAFHEPHEPVASPEALVAGYRGVARDEDEAQYFANVENVDRAVGRLLAGLEAAGKDGNTLVVFTSDNGPETLRRYRGAERSYGSPGPLRGMKLWTTEAGFRVAGIARWPGVVAGGRTIDVPVSSLDLLPTFCELAGAAVPSGLALDGVSLAGAIGGGAWPEREKPLVWCYYNAINERRVAMRHGEWKVLARLDGLGGTFSNVHTGNAAAVKAAGLKDIQIFRVTEDIDESEDLAGERPEELARLSALLRAEYGALVADSPVWERRAGGE